VLQAALQAAWAEILVETASSFHGLDSPSKAALKVHCKCLFLNLVEFTQSPNKIITTIYRPTLDCNEWLVDLSA
jgi:hypothetical protein